MSDSATEANPIKRWPIAVHVSVQIVAIFVIFFLCNYMSCRHYNRLDLTQSEKFTLSTFTTNFLHNMSSDVDVIVAFSPNSELFNDVRSLVDEYRLKSDNKVRVEILNPSHFPNRAAEVKAKYNVTLDQDLIIVAQGERVRVLGDADLAVRAPGGLITQFTGEIGLTASLVELLEERQRKIYVITGYQRQEFIQQVGAEISNLANRQNAIVDFLDLSKGSVPSDADALILASPQTDLAPSELKALLEYWNQRGSIYLSLDPDAETPNLHSFLRSVGAAPRPDRVLQASSISGGPIQTRYEVPAMVRKEVKATRELAGMGITLRGRSQSIHLTPAADHVRNQNIQLTPLLVANPDFWGETDFDKEPIVRDRDLDNHTPLYLGVMIERGAVDDPNLRVETQRMVLVSNPMILTGGNQRQKVQSDFVITTLNWLLDRTHLQGVLPKEPTRYAVTLSGAEKSAINLLVIWILPSLALLLGFFVWLTRRG